MKIELVDENGQILTIESQSKYPINLNVNPKSGIVDLTGKFKIRSISG